MSQPVESVSPASIALGTASAPTPAEPQTPAAATPAPAEPATPPAKRTLEDSLTGVDDDTKTFILGEVAKARRDAADSRGNAKAKAAEEARNELAQSIGKALGLVKDEPVDPVKLTEQLTVAGERAKTAEVELAVFRAASDVGADPSKLLDSRSFLDKVAGLDPADALGIAAAVGEAMMANPSFVKGDGRRLPAPNPALGSSASGAPNIDDQIAAAKKAGDVKTWMHLENQKLAAPGR